MDIEPLDAEPAGTVLVDSVEVEPFVVAPDQQAPARAAWPLVVGVVAVFAAAVVLRFWARSDLWLDEAQTVAIAKLPLARIPAALRQDGSPPLYYFLLHFWMRAFGTSDVAVRSLSGVFGVAALPLMWLAARRTGARAAGFPGSRSHGHAVAWAATLVLAVSPFAVRYSTEARMYTMVVALVLCGHLALGSALERPTLARLAALAVVSGLLMLSHYWTLYLLAAVLLVLAWRCWHPTPVVSRPAAVQAACAVVMGSALFAPWVPSFRYQLLHTGTPWAKPAYLGNLGTTISDFFGMGTNGGRLLGFLVFALALFGLFGRAVDGTHIDFDLRGRPAARPLAFVFVATMFLALSTAPLFGGAYAPRYTAVVLAPLLVLAGLGVGTLADRKVRRGVVAVAVLGSLAAAVPNVTMQRTQAQAAAATIEAWGYPGDVVVYCPDQVAPAMNRVLPAGFVQMPYPGGSAARVDWVDYARRFARSSPAAFAGAVARRAGNMHNIWVVWSPDYPPTTGYCTRMLSDLEAVRPLGEQMFGQDSKYFEHEYLERFFTPDDINAPTHVPRPGPLQ